MPPPSKPRPSVVERGGGDIEDDPERLQGTQAKIKVPAPSVSRGGKSLEDDPELLQGTQAKIKVPPPPPSRGGGRVEDDPEMGNLTNAQPKHKKGKPRAPSSWEAPPGKMSREVEKGDERSYETGNAYASIDEEPSTEGKPLNLEGDGLDALDADPLPPKTKAIPASDAEDPEDSQGADDDNATNAGKPLVIEITAGPDAGQKKKFRGVRMVIGRTPGVDLLLSDQSVSRKHVELVQGDGGVLLRDLGSGNGTRVNGSKTAEKILEHGDEIHIGKTKMRFVDEMAAFKKLRDDAEKKEAGAASGESPRADEAASSQDPAAASGDSEASASSEGSEGGEAAEGEGEPGDRKSKTSVRPIGDRGDRKPVARRGPEATGAAAWVERFKALPPKTRLLVMGGAGGMMLLFLILAFAGRAPPPPVEDPRSKQAHQKMQDARELVRQMKYEEAIPMIEAAEKLEPGVDTTKLAAVARDELAIQRGLEAVKALIDQGRFDDARTELARVAKGSIKTEDQKKVIDEQLRLAEAKYKRGELDKLLAAGEVEAAAKLMAELPDSDQREVAPQIAAAQANAEELKKQAELDARRQAANAVAFSKNQKAEQLALAFAVVQRKFTGNEWERASAECDRVIADNPGNEEIRKRAKQLQGLIPNFGRTFEEGMKKFREGQIASSARPLRLARGYYQQIGLPSALGGQIDEKLAEASVMAGKDAMLRDDLATAAINFRDAVKLDPTDGKAKAGLDDVINKAEDLYQMAYMIKDRDPREALKKFKVVVDVTPPGSATHEKAKNQIAAMSP